MAVWRYAFFHFDQRFPLPSLRVRWAAKETKAEACRAEGHLLLAYLWRHAELPPLNYNFNWDAYEELGWDHLDQVTASQESSPQETPQSLGCSRGRGAEGITLGIRTERRAMGAKRTLGARR